MREDSTLVVFATLAGGAVLKYAAFVYLSRKAQQMKFQFVGKVSELLVYPIKSCRGMTMESTHCNRLGVWHQGVGDRHWTVSTKNGVYLTQRQQPRMALIRTSIHGNMMHLDAPGMETLKLQINPQIDERKISKVTIKTDTIESLDCGDIAANWFNRYLKLDGLRLHFSPKSMAKRDASKAVKNWSHDAKPGDITAFSDYCGYMLMGEESLNDLNNRLEKPVTMLNFRPNIVVSGCPAYEEDNWKMIKIGKAVFRQIDACTRCILTTVDQYKGEKSKDEEPLTTLKTYRLKEPFGPKPALGIHLALDVEGTINVGDEVYAIRE